MLGERAEPDGFGGQIQRAETPRITIDYHFLVILNHAAL
jgi:hypothetical protein